MRSKNDTFNFKSFGLRFLFALVMVLCSYNPTGYSYIHWLLSSIKPFAPSPLLAICGVALTIGWVIYIRATLRSLGTLGLVLAALLFACFIWLFIDLGWLSISTVSVFAWIALVLLSAILAIGMSWSHVRRQLSGQVDTDDVDK